MRPFKTARCVLRHQDQFLLAVHSRFWRARHKRWGLPGGGVEWRETPEAAVQREVLEELDVHLGTLIEVGPYHYKRAEHLVFFAELDTFDIDYDSSELVDIGWFTLPEVEALEREDRLHAGYELSAIRQALALTRPR